MDHDQIAHKLSLAFGAQKAKALRFIEKHNSCLPADLCPHCNEPPHVPGLRCPNCGYIHATSWIILRDTEWGYEAISLRDRHHVVAKFNVP
jgi:hypothetical protein